MLGVDTAATACEIKKAYYIKARESHPDRNLNDPESHARFQRIGEAYQVRYPQLFLAYSLSFTRNKSIFILTPNHTQVLSDERLRFIYDQRGKEGIEGTAKVDANQVLYHGHGRLSLVAFRKPYCCVSWS